MGLSDEERDRLRTARQDSPRGVLLAMIVGFIVLAGVFVTRGGTSELPVPWNVVVPLLPLALLVALAVPLLLRIRRRGDVPLLDGADPATRRAVNRAIRDGFAPDKRIDDLVVDLREQFTPRQLGLLATIQIAGALALGTAAVLSREPVTWILLGIAAVSMVAAAVLQIRRRRQLIAYRPGGAPTAEPPAAAKGD
jgi:energy-coupling factor transporter transmembrane protein EcfT